MLLIFRKTEAKSLFAGELDTNSENLPVGHINFCNALNYKMFSTVCCEILLQRPQFEMTS